MAPEASVAVAVMSTGVPWIERVAVRLAKLTTTVAWPLYRAGSLLLAVAQAHDAGVGGRAAARHGRGVGGVAEGDEAAAVLVVFVGAAHSAMLTVSSVNHEARLP
ncbi:MAG: hypothetical protein U1F49_09290 [Rubrivivax sp.]